MPRNRIAEITLSPMLAADLDEVMDLERSCFPDPWPRDMIAVEVDTGDPQRFPIVAKSQGRVVGYMIVWFIADEVHLGNIAVSPEAQRTGLATMLIEYLVEEAKLRGSAHVVLEVRAGNGGAIGLYERNGFQAVAVRKEYYQDDNEDAIIMMRQLGMAEGGPSFG